MSGLLPDFVFSKILGSLVFADPVKNHLLNKRSQNFLCSRFFQPENCLSFRVGDRAFLSNISQYFFNYIGTFRRYIGAYRRFPTADIRITCFSTAIKDDYEYLFKERPVFWAVHGGTV